MAKQRRAYKVRENSTHGGARSVVLGSSQIGSEETKTSLPCTVQMAVTVSVMTEATAAAANHLANPSCPEKWLQHSADEHKVFYPQVLNERLSCSVTVE